PHRLLQAAATDRARAGRRLRPRPLSRGRPGSRHAAGQVPAGVSARAIEEAEVIMAFDALPALLGGPPVRPQGPPDWPLPDTDVLAALQVAYADHSWGKYHGGRVEQLEQRLADYHGVPHVLACGSGTFAIELALRALRVGPGDEVAMAAYDYPGNFFAIHATGAMPVLVDVESGNCNL